MNRDPIVIDLPDKNYERLLTFSRDCIKLCPSPGQMYTLKLMGAQPFLKQLAIKEMESRGGGPEKNKV